MTYGPLGSDEHQAFVRVYGESYAGLMSFVRRRVTSDAEAADVVQEAYLGLLRYRSQQDPAILRALLFRIALNIIGMRLRTARAHRLYDHVSLDEEGLVLIADNPAHDRQVAGEQQLDRLMEALEQCPPKCRQAFVLRRFYDLTLREIAARMNISTKTVENHITMALHLLDEKMGSERP